MRGVFVVACLPILGCAGLQVNKDASNDDSGSSEFQFFSACAGDAVALRDSMSEWRESLEQQLRDCHQAS